MALNEQQLGNPGTGIEKVSLLQSIKDKLHKQNAEKFLGNLKNVFVSRFEGVAQSVGLQAKPQVDQEVLEDVEAAGEHLDEVIAEELNASIFAVSGVQANARRLAIDATERPKEYYKGFRGIIRAIADSYIMPVRVGKRTEQMRKAIQNAKNMFAGTEYEGMFATEFAALRARNDMFEQPEYTEEVSALTPALVTLFQRGLKDGWDVAKFETEKTAVYTKLKLQTRDTFIEDDLTALFARLKTDPNGAQKANGLKLDLKKETMGLRTEVPMNISDKVLDTISDIPGIRHMQPEVVAGIVAGWAGVTTAGSRFAAGNAISHLQTLGLSTLFAGGMGAMAGHKRFHNQVLNVRSDNAVSDVYIAGSKRRESMNDLLYSMKSAASMTQGLEELCQAIEAETDAMVRRELGNELEDFLAMTLARINLSDENAVDLIQFDGRHTIERQRFALTVAVTEARIVLENLLEHGPIENETHENLVARFEQYMGDKYELQKTVLMADINAVNAKTKSAQRSYALKSAGIAMGTSAAFGIGTYTLSWLTQKGGEVVQNFLMPVAEAAEMTKGAGHTSHLTGVNADLHLGEHLEFQNSELHKGYYALTKDGVVVMDHLQFTADGELTPDSVNALSHAGYVVTQDAAFDQIVSHAVDKTMTPEAYLTAHKGDMTQINHIDYADNGTIRPDGAELQMHINIDNNGDYVVSMKDMKFATLNGQTIDIQKELAEQDIYLGCSVKGDSANRFFTLQMQSDGTVSIPHDSELGQMLFHGGADHAGFNGLHAHILQSDTAPAANGVLERATSLATVIGNNQPHAVHISTENVTEHFPASVRVDSNLTITPADPSVISTPTPMPSALVSAPVATATPSPILGPVMETPTPSPSATAGIGFGHDDLFLFPLPPEVTPSAMPSSSPTVLGPIIATPTPMPSATPDMSFGHDDLFLFPMPTEVTPSVAPSASATGTPAPSPSSLPWWPNIPGVPHTPGMDLNPGNSAGAGVDHGNVPVPTPNATMAPAYQQADAQMHSDGAFVFAAPVGFSKSLEYAATQEVLNSIVREGTPEIEEEEDLDDSQDDGTDELPLDVENVTPPADFNFDPDLDASDEAAEPETTPEVAPEETAPAPGIDPKSEQLVQMLIDSVGQGIGNNIDFSKQTPEKLAAAKNTLEARLQMIQDFETHHTNIDPLALIRIPYFKDRLNFHLSAINAVLSAPTTLEDLLTDAQTDIFNLFISGIEKGDEKFAEMKLDKLVVYKSAVLDKMIEVVDVFDASMSRLTSEDILAASSMRAELVREQKLVDTWIAYDELINSLPTYRAKAGYQNLKPLDLEKEQLMLMEWLKKAALSKRGVTFLANQQSMLDRQYKLVIDAISAIYDVVAEQQQTAGDDSKAQSPAEAAPEVTPPSVPKARRRIIKHPVSTSLNFASNLSPNLGQSVSYSPTLPKGTKIGIAKDFFATSLQRATVRLETLQSDMNALMAEKTSFTNPLSINMLDGQIEAQEKIIKKTEKKVERRTASRLETEKRIGDGLQAIMPSLNGLFDLRNEAKLAKLYDAVMRLGIPFNTYSEQIKLHLEVYGEKVDILNDLEELDSKESFSSSEEQMIGKMLERALELRVTPEEIPVRIRSISDYEYHYEQRFGR